MSIGLKCGEAPCSGCCKGESRVACGDGFAGLAWGRTGPMLKLSAWLQTVRLALVHQNGYGNWLLLAAVINAAGRIIPMI